MTLHLLIFDIIISVAGLPTDYDTDFRGARAVTSASGQGAIVQMKEHFYEVSCEISGCAWTIWAQNLDKGVSTAVTFMLPINYTSNCNSCAAGFFGDFCEGKYNFATKFNSNFFQFIFV